MQVVGERAWDMGSQGRRTLFKMQQASYERPAGVTMVAVFNFVVGAICLLIGALAVFAFESDSRILKDLFTVLGAVVGVYGAITVITAWGLWTGKSWGWWLEVILSGLALFRIIFGDILGAICGAIILWYFFKPHVKKYFDVSVDIST